MFFYPFCIKICFVSICYITANKPIWNETHADALKRDLLISYDKFARPTQHYNTTKVSINLKVKHVEFDEATSIFTVFAWIIMVMFLLCSKKLF